jgi:hypothetical protein
MGFPEPRQLMFCPWCGHALRYESTAPDRQVYECPHHGRLALRLNWTFVKIADPPKASRSPQQAGLSE